MDDLQERLSASTLDKLILGKGKEIQAVELQLNVLRLELFAFVQLNKKLAYSKTDGLWADFIADLTTRNPELSLLLQQCTLILMEPGKLFLRASERDKQMVDLMSTTIEQELSRFFEVGFQLRVESERK